MMAHTTFVLIPLEVESAKARQCFTFCASTWADGSAGPAAISTPAGAIPASLRKELNDAYPGEIFVLLNNNSGTHMMNSESALEMFEGLYSSAFKLKRNQLKLPADALGCLVCDGFTGSHSDSQGYLERRHRWAAANHVLLPQEQPGGWSARGQPCDQVFAHYKERVRLAMDC